MFDDVRAASEFENDEWADIKEPELTISEHMSLCGIEYYYAGYFLLSDWE